jgi:predicted phage-related endonuclease
LFKKEVAGKKVEADLKTIELIEQLHTLNSSIATQESAVAQIKQAVTEHMQDAEILTHQDKVIATWKTPKPSYRLDSKRIAVEQPEIYAQYEVAITNSRRLVFKNTGAQQNISA